jgi:tRNA nucleotidyltransferase (CCA-adding enzyme)
VTTVPTLGTSLTTSLTADLESWLAGDFASLFNFSPLDLGDLDLSNLDRPTPVEALSPALAPERWPFSLECLPKSACLVGGSVRDALLGRRSDYLDLDFVLPERAVETAQALARRYQAGFVLLDAERHIARVVFKQATVDFAQQVGPTLTADLERRDFTINAIAYNPHTEHLLDPLGGYRDLQQRCLRMVSDQNLQEDPLRLLRAYRQAAQLGFIIQPETRSAIRRLAPLLNTIAAERVQVELQYLLTSPHGTPWLQAAWLDGLLADWLPNADQASIDHIALIDLAVQDLQGSVLGQLIPGRIKLTPQALPPNTSDLLPGNQRSWRSLAKLTCLLPLDLELAERQLRRLKYSRTEIQAGLTVLDQLPILRSGVSAASFQDPGLSMTRRQQCKFFQAAQATFPSLALRLWAEAVLTQRIQPQGIEGLVQRFVDALDPVAHPQALLSGQALMTTFDLPPGPQIGELLTELQLAQAEGLITSVDTAIAHAGQWLAARLNF